MGDMISLWLPFPPSTNGLYSGKARRFKSERYKEWIVQASLALSEQYYVPITSKKPIQITFTLARPDKRIRDEQNYAKATTDFLVARGVILDDRYIGRTITEWADMVGKSVGSGVEVEIVTL
jgi:Holliday junction resolvase RusA-like endonuclease